MSFLLITATAFPQSQPPQDKVNFYEKGLEEKENKNYTEALEIWQQAQTTLEEPDFRIAYDYLKLVTEEELKKFYQKATDLYLWGLSGTISESEQETLLKDILLLKPLIGNKSYRNLKKKIEDNNSQALSEIKNFWENLDPTPLNSYNERLIEHWERITYAKENYTLPNSEELDPRGNIYLKYGEPYYARSGQLNYNAALVHRLLLEGIQTPSFASADRINIASAQRYNLETRVRQLHKYPKYEVWVYRNLTNDIQNTIFLFGNKGNSQRMNKLQSIEDFIPKKAYRNLSQHNYSVTISNNSEAENNSENSEVEFDADQSSSGGENVSFSPALILQLMYYDQFAALDQYFGQSYNNMMDQYIDRSNIQGSSMSGMAREFGTMYGNKLIQIQNAAPEEKSKDKAEIFSIPSENHTYRFLDENNNPYLKTFSKVDLQDALYYNLLKDGNSVESGLTDYALVTGYILKDENKNSIGKDIGQHAIASNEVVNVVDIPFDSEAQTVTLSHELHKVSKMADSTISGNSPYAESLKGLFNDDIEFPEPLETEELELSDIIIGYTVGTDNQISPEDSLSFNIAHDKVIPEDSDLNLYYELYNLEPKDDGVSEFTFHYSIHEKSKSNGFLGLGIFKKDPEDEISITLNNSVPSDRYGNTLIIETSNLEKGEYELDILIEDINSGSEYSQSIPFKIVE